VSDLIEPVEFARVHWQENLAYSVQAPKTIFTKETIKQAHEIYIQGINLLNLWASSEEVCFSIAEVNFSAGLNFLLTWNLWKKYAPKNKSLFYFASVKHPFSKNDLCLITALWPELQVEAAELIQSYPILTRGFHLLKWDKVTLVLMIGDPLNNYHQLLITGDNQLEKQLRTSFFDAWFFNHVPENTASFEKSVKFFKIAALLSHKNTHFCLLENSGDDEKALRESGWLITRYGNAEREMKLLFGILQEPISLKPRITPWYFSKPQACVQKHAIILGAGLSGCFLANNLAKKGWQITLLESELQVAGGASGNSQAILYPKISAYDSPLLAFLRFAHSFAFQYYKNSLRSPIEGELKGILQLAGSKKEQKSQNALNTLLRAYPMLGRYVTAREASELASCPLEIGGIYIPNAGWIDTPALCNSLLKHKNITVRTGIKAEYIERKEGLWIVGDFAAPSLIIANGFQAKNFAQTEFLPIKPIRGQTTKITTAGLWNALKIPLCGEVHITPAVDMQQSVGATFHSKISTCHELEADNQANIDKIKQLLHADHIESKIVSQWVGVRGATPDYLPLVGGVPAKSKFIEEYRKLGKNPNQWIASSTAYMPGLYICAAFGSRGLLTIPLATEWLSSLLNHEPLGLPRDLVRAISPARFLLREMQTGDIHPI
jgi:tRNA 5-methylaminomethyl-2-thiouridine biosynthesis bifunctional protein